MRTYKHKHPIIDIYLPIVGRINPISEYIRQLLAEYIQYQNISANCWQNISNIRIHPPIVGRIYPIPEFATNKFSGAQFAGGQICRKKISGAQFAAKGPNLPGPNLPKKWQIWPQKGRGPIFRQIGEGPNLSGPNLTGPNLPRT